MAISVKSLAADGLDLSPAFGIVRHLFGYRDIDGNAYTPKALSLKTQLKLIKGKHLHVNVILVGSESFTADHFKTVNYGLQIMREIYGQVDLGVAKVNWQMISDEDAGAAAAISSSTGARDLTSDFTFNPQDHHDMFVVRTMSGADGWSGTGGGCADGKCNGATCDKALEDTFTGSVTSLNGSNDNVGNTFAHEVGHYLGLDHIPDSGNFIGGDGSSNSWTGIFDWQGDHMKTHCLIQDGV